MKYKIDNSEIGEEFLEDALILGIVCTLPDYQLCHYLRTHLLLNFSLHTDNEFLWIKKGRHYTFNVFEYKEPLRHLFHLLYNNKCDGEFLLPELKHFDFLWLMKGEQMDEETLAALQQTIRAIPSVTLVSLVTPDKIKHKEQLVM